jgi:putative phosphoesterase
MKIGILSDIHGNSFALAKVLDEALKLKVQHLLILGDLVGYYYDAIGVFDLLDEWNKHIVRGNHEDMLQQFVDPSFNRDAIRRKYGSALEIALGTLSPEKLTLIQNLATTNKLEFNSLGILIAHGSPWSTDQYIYPDANKQLLDRCDYPDLDYVFLGHTHYPMIYKSNHTLIINPGSVGQSRVYGGIADWGLLDTDNGVYVQKHSIYDTAPLLKMVREIDPELPYLYDVLKRNNN